MLYYAVAIVFVAAIESLLCSRMADRLAGNKGVPFHADKELASQVIGAVKFFQCDMRAVPTVMRIYEECMRMEAFAQPPAAHQTIVTRPPSS